MRDYCITRLNFPTALEAEVREELYLHPCLGLEFAEVGERIAARAYFEAEYPLSSLRELLLSRWPSLVWEGETHIRLAAEMDLGGEPSVLNLAGKEIILRGGPAFGSGAHPTTVLAAELIAARDLSEKSVLDVGTGTGVLAILAKRCGAKRVAAIEILPEARANAAENFRLNQVGDIVLVKDLKELEGNFDWVVANILSPTLVALAKVLQARVADGGSIVLSGILQGEKESVLQSFSEMGRERELGREGWVAFCLKKKFSSVP